MQEYLKSTSNTMPCGIKQIRVQELFKQSIDETMLPKISIVTPSFNQGQFLESTLQSVLSQNYPNLEYVVIDGGSQDNSMEIIKKYEHKLHYCLSEKDRGHGHALNKGFSQTSGEIMGWINSDDMYTAWSFEVVAQIFSQFPRVKWISGFNSFWNSSGAMLEASRTPKNIYDFLLGDFGWIQQESVFWRRELWDAAGAYINEDYDLMVDGELWSRFFQIEPLYTVDCVLGGYRRHRENRASQYRAQILDEMDRAIAGMKQACSPELLRRYRSFLYLQKLRKLKVPRTLISKMGARIFPADFKAAAYRNIRWENEMWIERTLPFTLPFKYC
jgi:glycosyltransferase involved in cell wall biosynthesis